MIKKLQLRGSAKEIGYEHGSQAKQEVHHSLETYETLFHGYQNITWSEAKERAQVHLKAIERYDPEMIEEMEGIADGAGVEFADILALNARSEIALTGYKGKAFSDGCTAMAVMNPIISDTIIGQNWDWKASQKRSLLLLDIQSKANPAITMVTEGGIIGKIGFNSAGVGICFNALITDKKSNEVPIHLGLRAVLNSNSLTKAISKVKGGQMASAASFLIGYDQGDGNGMAVNAEVSPFGLDYVGGDNGTLVHTNHICSNEIKKNLEDRNEFKFDDSALRKKRAEQLMQTSITNKEVINEQLFERWLSDEFNAPNSINHFENNRAPEHRRMETVFSIIINLSKRQAFLRIGNSLDNNNYEKVENSFLLI
ncbi:C45 family peptidase [Lentibacillus sp. N15]|uniref:C45 family peptidase n=1 Tax=Lentibacillus songyuanensis TaxID=3136161 RepID=UPI0031BB6C23